MSKSTKPTRDDLKNLKVGKSFPLNKSLLVEALPKGYLFKTQSGRQIFQSLTAKSMVEFLKAVK